MLVQVLLVFVETFKCSSLSVLAAFSGLISQWKVGRWSLQEVEKLKRNVMKFMKVCVPFAHVGLVVVIKLGCNL